MLDRVQAGEVVVITRHGHPVAKMVPAASSNAQSTAVALETLKQIRSTITRKGAKIARKDILQFSPFCFYHPVRLKYQVLYRL